LIALDTNILVYARREESVHHDKAKDLLLRLSEGDEPWALPWPCIYEFLRIVTHPRIFTPPTSLENAIEDLESLFASPSLTLLGEGPAHAAHLRRFVLGGVARGNLAHDAHIAALVHEHGVRELLTTDRDFSRFPGLKVRNPFENILHEAPARYRKAAARRERA
jgi:toxin-antitoxin system PIN domain toxin